MQDQVYKYEETHLKAYAGDNFESAALFKNVQKVEIKDKWEALHNNLQNPYKTMKLWLRWEQLDITSILEAVDVKNQLEGRKSHLFQKKIDYQKELEKLNQGKSTLKTMFTSKDGKVNRITELTRKIAGSEKEMECIELYVKIIILQINQAAIPYFKRDKVHLYNDLLNTYSQQHMFNSQAVIDCYKMIKEANHVMEEDQPQCMTKSVHQLE